MDGDCYFPQIVALEEIHNAYQNATFILNLRNVSSWVRSVTNFNPKWRGILPKYRKFTLCFDEKNSITERNATNTQLAGFYEAHIHRIRDFVIKYPSHKLIEI